MGKTTSYNCVITINGKPFVQRLLKLDDDYSTRIVQSNFDQETLTALVNALSTAKFSTSLRHTNVTKDLGPIWFNTEALSELSTIFLTDNTAKVRVIFEDVTDKPFEKCSFTFIISKEEFHKEYPKPKPKNVFDGFSGSSSDPEVIITHYGDDMLAPSGRLCAFVLMKALSEMGFSHTDVYDLFVNCFDKKPSPNGEHGQNVDSYTNRKERIITLLN